MARNFSGSLLPEEVAEITLAAQEIIIDKIARMVMTSYAGYLLKKVKETQFEERNERPPTTG